MIEDFPDRATAAEDPNSFANTIRNKIRPTTRGQRRRWAFYSTALLAYSQLHKAVQDFSSSSYTPSHLFT